MLIALCVALALLCIAFAYIPSWPVRLVLMVLAAGIAPFANPFMAFLAAYTPPERQGRDMSVITAINDLPGLVTAPVAAVFLPIFGYSTVALLSIALLPALLIVALTPAMRTIPEQSKWVDHIAKIRAVGA